MAAATPTLLEPVPPDWELEVSPALEAWLLADGRVVEHRDYWDAAEQLYEKLPLIGGVLRLLKRSMR